MHALGHCRFSTYSELATITARTSNSIYKCIKSVFNQSETIQTNNADITPDKKTQMTIKIADDCSCSDDGNITPPPTPSFTPTSPFHEIKKSTVLSGMFGDVIIDDSDFVIKTFKKLSEINISAKDKLTINIASMASEEVELFKRYYGEAAAELIEQNGLIAIKMKKVEGISIDKISDDEFEKVMSENIKSFHGMLSKLFELNIFHADFLLKNIMFHHGVFFPIDFSNSTPENIEENLNIMKAITEQVKNNEENMTLTWEKQSMHIDITLEYNNKRNNSAINSVYQYPLYTRL